MYIFCRLIICPSTYLQPTGLFLFCILLLHGVLVFIFATPFDGIWSEDQQFLENLQIFGKNYCIVKTSKKEGKTASKLKISIEDWWWDQNKAHSSYRAPHSIPSIVHSWTDCRCLVEGISAGPIIMHAVLNTQGWCTNYLLSSGVLSR
jgi:hypothetical protein